MLYLEDFIELIESLPQSLRDRFTEMREADLTVQNNIDDIEQRVKTFFSNAKKMKPNEREAEHQAIMSQYKETLKVADEKVAQANDMQDILKLYKKKLDQDLILFKNDLEDDNKGITDILEKRSLELDQKTVNSSQKENRYSITSSRSRDNHSHSRSERRRDSNASSTSVEKRVAAEKVLTATANVAASSSASLQDSRPSSTNSGSLVGQSTGATSAAGIAASQSTGLANSVSTVNYSLGHIGAGGNAIAAAASQAIAATQHMQQGRRTASLKASYEAINTGGVHAAEFSRELAGAAQTAIAAIQESSKKNKKKVSSASVPNASVIAAQQSLQQQQQHQQQQQAHLAVQQHHHQQQQQPHHQHHQQQTVQAVQIAASSVGQTSASTKANSAAAAAAAVAAAAAAAASVDQTATVTDTDWPVDPNEPRYCICNQVSYGDMVACDNSNCPFEWFHYPCVNITAPPEGEWYCPQCAPSMKRRSNRKN